MATLTNLVVQISGNTASLNRSLDKAQTRMQKFGASVKKALGQFRRLAVGGALLAGAAVAGFAIAAVKSFAQVGDEIQKMALRTGFSTESLSELRFAAEQSGTDLDTLEKAIKRMATTIYDAELGLSTAVDAFNAMGISVQDFEGLSPEEQFFLLTDALSQVEDASLRSALAQRVFGRAGTALLPLLAQGETGLEALREEAQRLGIVFSQDAADSAAEFNDALNRFKHALMAAFFPIAETVLPLLTRLLDYLVDNRENIIAFFRKIAENPFTEYFIAGLKQIYNWFVTLLSWAKDNQAVMIGILVALGAAMVVAFGPIPAIILGIIIAIGFLSTHWDTIWKKIQTIFASVSGKLSALYRSRLGWLLPGGIFVKGLLYVKDNWTRIWSTIQSSFRVVVNSIVGNINRIINAFNAVASLVPGVSNPVPTIPGFANGVRNFRGGPAIVGERGPELVTLPRGANVIPNGGGAGGMTVNINFNGDVYGVDDFNERVNQARLEFERRAAVA